MKRVRFPSGELEELAASPTIKSNDATTFVTILDKSKLSTHPKKVSGGANEQP